MMRSLFGDLPTCVQRVNYPVHKGKPNPSHGTFYFVGSIPGDCTEPRPAPGNPNGRGSKHYASEDEAITAAIAAGAKRIQRCDCSFVNIARERSRLQCLAIAQRDGFGSDCDKHIFG